LEIEGRTASNFEVSVAFGLATPGYLSAMKIPIVRGRDFTAADRAGQPSVAIINEALARQFFPGQDPIGQRIRVGNASDKVLEIVGVSGNVRHDLTEFNEVRPMVWRPYAQVAPGLPMSLVVRSRAQDAAALVSVVRAHIARLDPTLPIYDVRSMDDVFDAAMAQPRFSTTVLGLFAVVALALAALGVYGVMAYSTSQRRREMGIRLALGAQRSDIIRLVLGQGMQMAAIGAAIGLSAAVALTRLLESQLYGVSVLDPLPFVGTPLVLISAAVLACWVPAWRASRVDPMVALRYE
jgi:putative ABC transport system permease protein